MQFFFPDSQDQVNPLFDMITEEHVPHRVRQRDDRYAHEVLSASPFDGILITAAAPQVPPALVKQLSEGGILVVPEGANQQVLRVYRKTGDKLEVQNLEAVRFVPLLDGVER